MKKKLPTSKETARELERVQLATTPVSVTDMNNLGFKTRKVKEKLTPLAPAKQDIASLFSVTPEALSSIVRRWRDVAGHRAIGRAKSKLLKVDPSPALVQYILNGATASYDDADMGGIDSRVLYTELAKCINDKSLLAAIDSCKLSLETPEFFYDEGEVAIGKLSAMWVLHPVFGERVLATMLLRFKGANTLKARRDAMLAVLKREPNRLIDAVLAGRVSKLALDVLKTWKNPFASGGDAISIGDHSVIWTKIALVRAALWPEETLKYVTREPRAPFTEMFCDSTNWDSARHWWPTRKHESSKSVYEERISGETLRYFELILVTAMGALFDKYDRRDMAKSVDLIDSTLSKLPHVKVLYFYPYTWRRVLALAYRHEHMVRIVHHLSRSWKGFAQMALTDETVDWLTDMVMSVRGRLPDIHNQPGRANRLGKSQRLTVMLHTIYNAADCEVEGKVMRADKNLSKWVRSGVRKNTPDIASMEAAKKFFLLKDISGKLVSDDMVSLAAGLTIVADAELARRHLLGLDADTLRGLLIHGNNDFVLYLYSLDPVFVWAIEYPRTFTSRIKSVQDKIRKMLPAWLVGVTDKKKATSND